MQIDIHDITPALLKPTLDTLVADACVRASNALKQACEEGTGLEDAVIPTVMIDDVLRSAVIAEMQRVDVAAVLSHLKEIGHPWVPDVFGANLERDYVWARRASCYLTPKVRNRGDMDDTAIVRLSPAAKFLIGAGD